jgi:hypothetical protein
MAMSIMPDSVDEVTFAFGGAFKARLDAVDAALDAVRDRKAVPKVNPRDHWPASTDAETWELGPDLDPEDPRDHAVAFVPSRHDELYRLGYELGLERENANISAIATANDAESEDLADLAAFHGGFLAGREEWDRRLEEMCGSAAYADFSNAITDRDVYPAGCVS